MLKSVSMQNLIEVPGLLDNIKINKYAKFDTNILCGSRLMGIFANWPQKAGRLHSNPISIKNRWVSQNVDIHMYAKSDKNILCGSRVMNIFANW